MKALSSEKKIRLLRESVNKMVISERNFQCDFDPAYIRARGWKVVPAEPTGGHFSEAEKRRLVSALRTAGFRTCFAVATEPLGDWPVCYQMRIDLEEFREFDRTLGIFRFLLMDSEQTWAISCTEWYLLFAAAPDLLEVLLGRSIAQARLEFHRYVHELEQDPNARLRQVAETYASL